MALNLIFVLHIQIFFSQPTGYVTTYTVFNPITTLSEAIKMSINNTFFYKEEDISAHDCEPIGVCALISLNAVFFIYLFIFFFWSFTALSRIFYLYRADSSSKVGEKRRTWRKTTWPSVSRTWLSQMWLERGLNHSGEKPSGLRVNSPIH